MKRMTLVGTIHIDPEGKLRLEHALEFLAPDILTVEIPHDLDINETYNQIQKKMKILETAIPQNIPNGMRTVVQLAISNVAYELTTSYEYAMKRKIPLHFVDCTRPFFAPIGDEISNISDMKDKTYPAYDAQFIRECDMWLKDMYYGKTSDVKRFTKLAHEYCEAERKSVFMQGLRPYAGSKLAKRDEETAGRIMDAHTDGHLVHVAGLDHLYPEKIRAKTTVLKDLLPGAETIRLCDAIMLGR